MRFLRISWTLRGLPALVAAVTALAGCAKLDDLTAPISAPPVNNALGAFHTRYGVASQLFTYDPQRISVFFTARGNSFAVGYKAFLSVGTNESVVGPVQLEVREVVSKSEMLLSGISTMAGGEVLETGGQYFFRATQDHRSLRLSPRIRLGFAAKGTPQLAGSSPLGMQFYYVPSPAVPTLFNWAPVTDTTSSLEIIPRRAPTDPDVYRYLLGPNLHDLGSGWVSFARPFSLALPTPVTVTVDAPAGDTEVFLVFNYFNAIAQLAATPTGTFSLAGVPTGADVTVVVLRATPDLHTLYFGTARGLVSPNQQFAPTLTPMSDAAVAAALSKL